MPEYHRSAGNMAKRSYNQYCGLARALDILGERWMPLVIRELLFGPKRFTDLLDGLPGIGANLLAARLKDLQAAGLVERRKLPAPAASTVYELTELGRGLEPAFLALTRWGMNFLGPPTPDDRFHPAWYLNALRVVFQPERARGVTETYEFHVDEDVFFASVDDGTLDVGAGTTPNPAAVITTDFQTFAAVGIGELSPQEALSQGKARVEGDMEAALRAAEMLTPLPAARAAAVHAG
jgi:DNA-binding HxlR family transcriptional regulator/putative sterol carrier protein